MKRLKNKVHDGENILLKKKKKKKKKKTLQFSYCFSCGLIILLAERLHEFKFPGASTIRSNTVVGPEPSKGNLLQHRSCGPVAHRLCVRVRSGHDFFLPCVIMYVGFVIYMLMGIKICDLYTSIKPSLLCVFKLANVRNDGYCQRSVYDLLNIFFDIIFL